MVTEGPRPMSGPLRRDVMIANPEGFHMRPAAAFAELASRFESKVTVSCGGESVDGKFWPDLLLLASKATQGAMHQRISIVRQVYLLHIYRSDQA